MERTVTPPPEPIEPEPATPATEEVGGAKRPEPTRFGDWELNGKCVDF